MLAISNVEVQMVSQQILVQVVHLTTEQSVVTLLAPLSKGHGVAHQDARSLEQQT